jgi:hypothetical protein
MRKLLAAAVLTLTVLGVAAPAAAGGWAVTTLDPLAAAPAAGEPFDVGFTVRQHGRTPVSMPDAAIIVTDAAGVATRFAATPEGAVGHHVATVVLPTDGTYSWAVEHQLGTQELGSVRVGSTGSGGTAGGTSPWTVPLFAVAAVLAGLGLADLARGTLARRRHAALPA